MPSPAAQPGYSWAAPAPSWGPPAPGYGWSPPAAVPAGRWTLRPVAVLGIVVASAVVAALLTALAFSAFRTGESVASTVAAVGAYPPVDPSTLERFDPVPPGDLGPDPTLDTYAEECFGGGMQSCDDLYWSSPPLSDYEAYGETCGGRVKEGTGVYCTDLD